MKKRPWGRHLGTQLHRAGMGREASEIAGKIRTAIATAIGKSVTVSGSGAYIVLTADNRGKP